MSILSRLLPAPPADPRPFSAVRPLPGSHVYDRMMLDEALSVYTGPDRASSLAAALGIWAVRKFGGEGASRFADALVGVVQNERRAK